MTGRSSIGKIQPAPEADVGKDRVRELLEQTDEASRQVNNVYLTFLLFGTYVMVTIASTTHEQLLRVSPVTLPLLNVGVPIVGFYAFVPWLLLLFHFNLLLQLYLLSRKLHRLDAAFSGLEDAAGAEQRTFLFSFPFTHMLIGRHGRLIHACLTLMVWVAFILLPVAILLWAQITFLPFHNLRMTGLHRLVLHLDLALLWVFWPMIVTSDGNARAWWRAVQDRSLQWIRAAMKTVRSLRPKRQTGKKLEGQGANESAEPAHGLVPLVSATLLSAVISLFLAVVPGEVLEHRIARVLPEPWVVRAKSCPNGCWAATFWLFDRLETPFSRNLSLVNAVLLAEDPPAESLQKLRSSDPKERDEALRQVRGLKLTNRDLRYADLRSAILAKADLRGSLLHGADLRGADLASADLRPYDTREGQRCLLGPVPSTGHWEHGLGEAPVCQTLLKEANLSGASLDGARLLMADLSGANLSGATLRRAALSDAKLQRANLRYAKLDKANLESADLRGADLEFAELPLANLTGAKAQSAHLGYAKLVGASLAHARFQGADLSFTHLSFADATLAQLQGADLRRARLVTARFFEARLEGADLRSADIGSADFTAAQLDGADLRSVRREVPGDSKPYEPFRIDGGIPDYEWERFGTLDTLSQAALPRSPLCGEGRPFPTGLTEDRIGDYAPNAAAYLADLSCGNPDVAEGIVGRITRRRELAFNDDFLRPSFDEPRFARALLAPTCKGAAGLSTETRSALQRIARGRTADPSTPPHDLPVPEGFEETGSGWSDIRDEGRLVGFKLTYWVKAPPSQVLSYYQKKLSQGAWEVSGMGPIPAEGGVLRYRRKDLSSTGMVRVFRAGPEIREEGWTRIELSLTEPRSPSRSP